MARNAIVPIGHQAGRERRHGRADGDDAEGRGQHRDRRRAGRTASRRPAACTTATSTNPAIRLAASAGVSPYAVFRYVGR